MLNAVCLQLTRWIHYADELHSTYVATCIANGLCSFVAVTGNLVIVLAILRNSSLHTPSYVLLCNLAISDLGVGLVAQPLFIALRVAESRGQVDLACKLGVAYFSIAGWLAWLSLLTVTAISVDRFLAVHLAIKYRSAVTVRKAKLVVAFLWIIAVIVGMIYVIDMAVYFVVIMTIISFCLLLASCSYFSIGRELQQRHAMIQGHNHHPKTRQQHGSSFNVGRYRKTVTSMLYVYGAFLLCYLPYLCFSVALKLIGRTSTVHGAYLITATLVLWNSALNPCLYYWRISELRLGIKQLLGWEAAGSVRESSLQGK